MIFDDIQFGQMFKHPRLGLLRKIIGRKKHNFIEDPNAIVLYYKAAKFGNADVGVTIKNNQELEPI